MEMLGGAQGRGRRRRIGTKQENFWVVGRVLFCLLVRDRHVCSRMYNDIEMYHPDWEVCFTTMG
jgi:hypothetical protein